MVLGLISLSDTPPHVTNSSLKAHLPVIILIAVLGALSGSILLTVIRDNAAMFNAGTFTFTLIGLPCVIMVIASFIISVTAREIGSRMLVIVEAICVVLGIAATVVASGWQADPAITSVVLANSGDGATITPMTNSPFGIIRNVMLYLLCPMVGSVAGAWVGSRLHPVSVDVNNKKSKPAKTKSSSKKRQG